MASLLALVGCYRLVSSNGAGQTTFEPPRRVDAADVAVPDGYRIEVVATGLSFPTGVAFDDRGRVYVTESGYSYGEVFSVPRLLEIGADGTTRELARGDKDGPWTGLTWHAGSFYVASGSVLEGGSILKIAADGRREVVVGGLPSFGDHHTNGPMVGPDGWLYFAQGTATNAGIVGEDNQDMGWLARKPGFHDIPCRDVTVRAANVTTPNPLGQGRATTGPFQPFGTPVRDGQVVAGQVPCSGAVMRVRPEGGAVELVVWGLRNPYGLAFAPDGRLFATDNQYDERGSRPVFGAGDLLHRIEPGVWYGWPDYHGDTPVDLGDRYKPPGKETPVRLLARDPGRPPKPAAVLGVHASADGFDFSRNPAFGHVGEAFIAEFGDQAPVTGKVWVPVGARVVRVDPTSGVVHDFAVNRGETNGPASWQRSAGLERPIAARFNPTGTALYVVDFGVMTIAGKTMDARPGTGVLWRVTRAPGGGR